MCVAIPVDPHWIYEERLSYNPDRDPNRTMTSWDVYKQKRQAQQDIDARFKICLAKLGFERAPKPLEAEKWRALDPCMQPYSRTNLNGSNCN